MIIKEIQRIGNLIAKSKATICCWAMGLTQHKNAVPTIQEISNLLLLVPLLVTGYLRVVFKVF